MKLLFKIQRQILVSGVTLIEVLIYTVLLSLLMASLIQFLYAIHEQDFLLINEIQDAS